MYSFNRLNNTLTLSSSNTITTSSVYGLFNISRKPKRRLNTTIPTTPPSLVSNTPPLSSSTIQYQQSAFDESYSVKTGIKIAALLGGMLVLVIIYLFWKARARLCRCLSLSTTGVTNSRLSANKFDLEYWLKQVDLLEAKEAERNREGLLPYLELPTEEPRNTQAATASWIVDAYRQWRVIHYRQQHQLLRHITHHQVDSKPVPYRQRRRRNILRRLIRRLLVPSYPRSSAFDQHAASLIADCRPSIVNNNLLSPQESLDILPRRVASWPRIKSTNYQNCAPMSALETRNTRKRLLRQPPTTKTLDMDEKKL